jgi:hypothetical protein
MRRAIAEVDGMVFEHSPVGLARQLRGRVGIGRVQVDGAAGRAAIEYDPARVGVRELPRLIAECGYVCRCCRPAKGARPPDRPVRPRRLSTLLRKADPCRAS